MGVGFCDRARWSDAAVILIVLVGAVGERTASSPSLAN